MMSDDDRAKAVKCLDKPKTEITRCKNQLGRRNLSPEQKRYLLGKHFLFWNNDRYRSKEVL